MGTANIQSNHCPRLIKSSFHIHTNMLLLSWHLLIFLIFLSLAAVWKTCTNNRGNWLSRKKSKSSYPTQCSESAGNNRKESFSLPTFLAVILSLTTADKPISAPCDFHADSPTTAFITQLIIGLRHSPPSSYDHAEEGREYQKLPRCTYTRVGCAPGQFSCTLPGE